MAAIDRKRRGESSALLELYRVMARIREFEEACRHIQRTRSGPGPDGEVSSPGHMPGFVHLYLGEEAIAVGVCSVLRPEDVVVSTHRGHGHLIAKGADIQAMMAELYGRSSGYSKGKGGSMHMFVPELGVLGTNGIVAAGIPHAVGAALSSKLLGLKTVAVAFFGDGACNQGVFFESMNLAALWSLPVLLVLENNLYSEWTESQRLTAGESLASRARPFGIPAAVVDGNDVLAVRDAAWEAVARARCGRGPTLIEARTYYYGGHFEGEEFFAGHYRSDADLAAWRIRDPILRFGRTLIEAGAAEQSLLEQMRQEEAELVARAVEHAVAADPPPLSELTTDLFADPTATGPATVTA